MIAPENVTAPEIQNEPAKSNAQADGFHAPTPESASLGIENTDASESEADLVISSATKKQQEHAIYR